MLVLLGRPEFAVLLVGRSIPRLIRGFIHFVAIEQFVQDFTVDGQINRIHRHHILTRCALRLVRFGLGCLQGREWFVASKTQTKENDHD